MRKLAGRVRSWARVLRRDVVALSFAARDPATPWHARVVAACVAAYALSPIDLIPDFVPVLGYLDDLIIVPLGIWLAIRLIPPAVLHAARMRAESAPRLVSRTGLAMVVAAWLGLGVALAWMVWP